MDATTEANQSCADRVHAYYLSRETFLENVDTVRDVDVSDQEAIDDAWDAFDNLGYGSPDDGLDVEDIAQEAIDTLPLSVDTRVVHTVTFSTGGPADGIDIYCDLNGDVARVVYWFADWFDRAEHEIRSGSRMWDYAEDIAELQRETF